MSLPVPTLRADRRAQFEVIMPDDDWPDYEDSEDDDTDNMVDDGEDE